MIYLLGYWGDQPDLPPDYRVMLTLSTWKSARKKMGQPNIIQVHPDQVELYKTAAEKYKLEIVPDPEFGKRHGLYHFGLNLKDA